MKSENSSVKTTPDTPGHSYCFQLDGVEYHTEHKRVTPSQIRQIASITDNDPIIVVNDDGTQRVIPEDEEVKLEHCSKFRRLPRFRRGVV